MNATEIRTFLEESRRIQAPMSPAFVFDKYDGVRHSCEVDLHIHSGYVTILAKLMANLRPTRLLTIGALFGTTESYLLQCEGGQDFIAEITICDLDMPNYNSNRDNGSIIYRNICGTQYGEFDREFAFVRGDSRTEGVKRKLGALGPYDLIFIDGEHSADAVYSDLELSSRCLAGGGTILVHDVALPDCNLVDGWLAWAHQHSPEFKCDAVGDDIFQFGLGFVQRSHSQM